MATLTPALIARTRSDERLFKRLGAELTRTLGPGAASGDDLDAFVRRLGQLPRGLRAMAAVYELDVSMTLDDLGWHFANWHHLGLAQETLLGLRELQAADAAAIFEQALAIVSKHWEFFGAPDFVQRYDDSAVERALSPLNSRYWNLFDSTSGSATGLLDYWVPYARNYPSNVCSDAT
jgi:hypothetical protein